MFSLWLSMCPFLSPSVHSIIPRHTLVAGYYVFTLAVHVSVRLSVVCLSVCPSALRFRTITNIYERISLRFFICSCTNNVSLGIVNGLISIINHKSYGTWQCNENGFWPLVPLLFGVS